MKQYALYFSKGPVYHVYAKNAKQAKLIGERVAAARGCKFVDYGIAINHS